MVFQKVFVESLGSWIFMCPSSCPLCISQAALSGGYSNEAIFSLTEPSRSFSSRANSVNDNVIRGRVMMLAIALYRIFTQSRKTSLVVHIRQTLAMPCQTIAWVISYDIPGQSWLNPTTQGAKGAYYALKFPEKIEKSIRRFSVPFMAIFISLSSLDPFPFQARLKGL